MKYTKEQIIAKAKLVMKDLEGKYYTENCIDTNINYLTRELVEYGKFKGKEIPLWLIAINSLFENHDFLHISDETGEPIYYQNFNAYIFDIEKDKDGKYFMKEVEY